MKRRPLAVATALLCAMIATSSAQARQGSPSLVVVPTAAGITITASPEFAPRAQAVIAAAVAEGMRFRSINCFSTARSHKSRSNHKAGDACDAYPSIPARIVRAAGLRSGCDFADCPHFDNAKNVGGMAFWNRVRHKTRFAHNQARHRHPRSIARATPLRAIQ